MRDEEMGILSIRHLQERADPTRSAGRGVYEFARNVAGRMNADPNDDVILGRREESASAESAHGRPVAKCAIVLLGIDDPAWPEVVADEGRLTVVDTEERLATLGSLPPGAETVAADLRQGIPSHVEALADGGVVVCAGTLDRWHRPGRLLRQLRALCDRAALVVISSSRPRLLTGRTWSTFLRGRPEPGHPHVVLVGGTLARRPTGPRPSLLAVITCYNEADIIEATVDHLLGQGADVRAVDNWSDDGSWEILNEMARTRPRLSLERWPGPGPIEIFELRHLLQRVEEIALETDYDWVLHNDADEFRQSPWPGVTLAQAFGAVEAAGFTTVDFSLLDFRPTRDGFARGVDPLTFFGYCELGQRQGYTQQVRAWRQRPGQRTLLVPSGGHDPLFEGRRLFPLNFVVRHYSFRSSAHGSNKLKRDRLPRLNRDEVAMGWHAHLKDFDPDGSFVWSPDELLRYDEKFRADYLLSLLGRVMPPEPGV